MVPVDVLGSGGLREWVASLGGLSEGKLWISRPLSPPPEHTPLPQLLSTYSNTQKLNQPGSRPQGSRPQGSRKVKMHCQPLPDFFLFLLSAWVSEQGCM